MVLSICIIIILSIFFFYLFNILCMMKESFCYGNIYCNRNKKSSMCIQQTCYSCGLQPTCTKDEDCAPNNCINGCCDQQ